MVELPMLGMPPSYHCVWQAAALRGKESVPVAMSLVSFYIGMELSL